VPDPLYPDPLHPDAPETTGVALTSARAGDPVTFLPHRDGKPFVDLHACYRQAAAQHDQDGGQRS
jgi:hypothetical protein